MTSSVNTSLTFLVLVSTCLIAQLDGQLFGRTLRPRQVKLPNGLYLPPGTTKNPHESEEDIQPGGYTPGPETTTKRPHESEEDIQPGGYTPPPEEGQQVQAAPAPEVDHWGGRPWDMEYSVKDDRGNDYSHVQNSDGDLITGEYRTLMPDGRVQVVSYTADWKNGYRAIVRYYPRDKPIPSPTKPPSKSPAKAK